MARKVNIGKPWRIAVLAVLLTAAIMASANVTYAYLFTNTSSAENTFIPAVVSCEVQNDYLDNVTSDVRIKNTGTTESYVRAAVVINWQDSAGNVLANTPVPEDDYIIVFNETDWFLYNGYWYCRKPVAVGYDSRVLIEECKAADIELPEGYHLSVEVVASAIQSQPDAAVQSAWGVKVVEGILSTP